MAFKNDTRGLGGQKEIMNLMQNHYSALLNIKPTINTRKPPRQHVSQISKLSRPHTTSQAPLSLEDKLIISP